MSSALLSIFIWISNFISFIYLYVRISSVRGDKLSSHSLF